MNQIIKYTCPKCGNRQYELGEIWTFDKFWKRIFNIYAKISRITCQKCKYTEFYDVRAEYISDYYKSQG
jgi:predicted nucleic-acid-binding Zn-ribbon protein